MPPAPQPGPVSRGEAPSSVINAVRLMYVSAALGILGMILLFVTKDELKKSIQENDAKLSGTELDNAVNGVLAIAVVLAIIFTVLWLVLANFVQKGKNWARIVTWILAAIGVLSVLGSFGQPPLNVVLAIIGGVINIAIIVLLALKPSSEYFSSRTS